MNVKLSQFIMGAVSTILIIIVCSLIGLWDRPFPVIIIVSVALGLAMGGNYALCAPNRPKSVNDIKQS